MSHHIVIHVPKSVGKYAPMLQDFVIGMVTKLAKNSHKNTPDVSTLPQIMALLQLEIEEFEEQLRINKFDENSLIELMDQANFSFLAYVALRAQGVKHEIP